MDAGGFIEASATEEGAVRIVTVQNTLGSSVASLRGVQRPVGSSDSGGRERSSPRGDLRRFRGPGGGVGADGVAPGSAGACGVGGERDGTGCVAMFVQRFRGSVSGSRGGAAGGTVAVWSGGSHRAARSLPLERRLFFPHVLELGLPEEVPLRELMAMELDRHLTEMAVTAHRFNHAWKVFGGPRPLHWAA